MKAHEDKDDAPRLTTAEIQAVIVWLVQRHREAVREALEAADERELWAELESLRLDVDDYAP